MRLRLAQSQAQSRNQASKVYFIASAILIRSDPLPSRERENKGGKEMSIEIAGKFKLGRLVWTRGVNEEIANNGEFAKFVLDSISRHARGDWGDMSREDKNENELALNTGNLRIFSAYESKGLPKIWIITESTREATTVLFPEEY